MSCAAASFAHLVGLALPDVGRGIGRRRRLQHRARPDRRPRCRPAARARRATPRRPRCRRATVPALTSNARAQPLEVDLGRGEPAALPIGYASASRSSRVRSMRCRLSDVDVEHVHDRPAEPDGRAERDGERPPSTSTRTRSPTSPRRCATAADAHAPVPHDCVSPAPRSHTRIVIAIRAGRPRRTRR